MSKDSTTPPTNVHAASSGRSMAAWVGRTFHFLVLEETVASSLPFPSQLSPFLSCPVLSPSLYAEEPPSANPKT